MLRRQFTANFKKSGKWYIGWVDEIPGVNVQELTKKEAKESLKEAIELILEANQTINRNMYAGKSRITRESIAVTV